MPTALKNKKTYRGKWPSVLEKCLANTSATPVGLLTEELFTLRDEVGVRL